MTILIINAGSSSLRAALFDKNLKEIFSKHIDRISGTHEKALKTVLKELPTEIKDIKKVGHRVVHGGEKFTAPTLLNAKTLREIEKLSPLAPLHNPANLSAAKACMKLLPNAAHYAIFDTAFHASLPPKAFLYGLPYKLYKKNAIRRYGFHGTNHKYVAGEAHKLLKKSNAKIISCHLGNGVSLAAIHGKKCLDTSMGFTPLEGPMMGTRSGSIDPAIIFHLAQKMPLKNIQKMLEHESGFLGLSENSSDIRDLWAKAASPETKRTFETFSYQVAKLITGYFTTLGGLPDAIVFTAGIGENAHYLRKQICDYLKPFGIQIEHRHTNPIISTPKSKTKIFVIPANESIQMAREIR